MTTTIRPVRTTVLIGFYETNTIGYYTLHELLSVPISCGLI
jgi:hypothetical protein